MKHLSTLKIVVTFAVGALIAYFAASSGCRLTYGWAAEVDERLDVLEMDGSNRWMGEIPAHCGVENCCCGAGR